MTRTEFQQLRGHHIRVCAEIRNFLKTNNVSLVVDPNGDIYLCDDNLGYTGDCVQEES